MFKRNSKKYKLFHIHKEEALQKKSFLFHCLNRICQSNETPEL